jgi:hypothetical protein
MSKMTKEKFSEFLKTIVKQCVKEEFGVKTLSKKEMEDSVDIFIKKVSAEKCFYVIYDNQEAHSFVCEYKERQEAPLLFHILSRYGDTGNASDTRKEWFLTVWVYYHNKDMCKYILEAIYNNLKQKYPDVARDGPILGCSLELKSEIELVHCEEDEECSAENAAKI